MSHKKKFGKNLNKIVQASAAPPIVKTDRASKNGLLLLSAKKSGGGSSLLSSKPSVSVEPQSPSAPQKSGVSQEVSTHEELLNAIGVTTTNLQKPDAWGKQNEEAEIAVTDNTAEDILPGPESSEEVKDRVDETARTSQDGDACEQVNNWDEYGGRGISTRGIVDQQADHMSRLARERAEKRRQDEELRLEAQKAKAHERLRELGGSRQQRTLWEPAGNGKVSATKPDDNRSNGQKDSLTPPRRRENENTGNSTAEEASSPEPVISLRNYEDRNRGDQRNPGAAPRMLFDPKSGSMVAVKKPAAVVSKRKKPTRTKNNDRQQRQTPKLPPVVSKVNPHRSLPRTRGVLYTKGPKGALISFDGCDGDDGPGAHSVPGGRVNNPESVAEVTGSDSGEPEAKAKPEPVWITADDNLELVGESDSPQLKPTAKVFAPSQAAIAAIQASKAGVTADEKEGIVDIDTDGEDHVLGITFDPIKDFVIPSRGDEKRTTSRLVEVGVGLDGLELDDSVFGVGVKTTTEQSKSPGSLFPFGTSATWGSTGQESIATSSDWGGGLFGKAAEGNVADATPFLNIPPNNSWGNSSLPGTSDSPAAD